MARRDWREKEMLAQHRHHRIYFVTFTLILAIAMIFWLTKTGSISISNILNLNTANLNEFTFGNADKKTGGPIDIIDVSDLKEKLPNTIFYVRSLLFKSFSSFFF